MQKWHDLLDKNVYWGTFFGLILGPHLAAIRAYSWLCDQRSLLSPGWAQGTKHMWCWRLNTVGLMQNKWPTHSNLVPAAHISNTQQSYFGNSRHFIYWTKKASHFRNYSCKLGSFCFEETSSLYTVQMGFKVNFLYSRQGICLTCGELGFDS